MFSLNDFMRYFLCPGPTDMRKSFYTLSGLVTDKMGLDVQSGDVFIFVNRKQDQMKILHAEEGGLVLYIKKLEAGTFRVPDFDEETKSFPMSWSDLVLLVKGIQADPDNRYKRLDILRQNR